MNKNNACFVTEIDLAAPLIGGGMINDLKMIRCLRKLGRVDVIYLQKLKYVPMILALMVFIFQLMRTFSKSYKVYFARSLIASAVLTMFKPVIRGKIVHQALSVPFPSREVKYLAPDARARSGQSRTILWIRYYLILFMEKLVLPNVDLITVAAPEYAEELIKFGVKRAKLKVVPFYVEDEFLRQPLKRNIEDTFTFCYVGAFHRYHELSSLIEAYELMSQSNLNTELLFIGNGPTRTQIESEVTRKNLSHKVKFLGSLPHSSMPLFLSNVDVFVLLTHAPGLPIGLIEAAAVGKAIIVN
ncbi:MAG: glycosyltransferase, partial [Candidatus Bathyarchaeota archaeon]|nr:glycosyltransferase [Candidatus Bathyarchaeota archaeon]